MAKIDLKDYRAIIFDLGGVILNIDYNLTSKAFRDLGFDDFDEVYSQARQSDVFDLFETGQISAGEFRDFIRSFKKCLSDDQINNAWNTMLLDLPKERIELLKNLRKELPIYLLSNTNEIHIKAFLKIVADTFGDANLFDSIFVNHYYSSEIGFRKPEANCFEYVIHENGLEPSKTLFIDDSIQHIHGAEQVGLKAYHLKNETIIDLFPGKAQ